MVALGRDASGPGRRATTTQHAVDATYNNKNLHPTLRPRVRVEVLERRPTPQTELLHQRVEADAFGHIGRRRPAASHRKRTRPRRRGVYVGTRIQ